MLKKEEMNISGRTDFVFNYLEYILLSFCTDILTSKRIVEYLSNCHSNTCSSCRSCQFLRLLFILNLPNDILQIFIRHKFVRHQCLHFFSHIGIKASNF